VSRSGWFRRQQSLLETSGTSATKRIWSRTRASSSPAPAKKRGAALTASAAALVFGAGVVVVALDAPGSHASAVASVSSVNRAAPARPAGPAAALQLVSVTPAAGAKGVNGASPIRVQFSSPIAANSPMPTLSPQLAGQWTAQGDAAVFTPAVGYLENTRVTVSIPSGASGIISAAGASAGAGGTLDSAVSKSSFTTGSYSTLGLQQLLAQLGYLPMTWQATSAAATSLDNARAELSAAYSPPAGAFSWQGSYPWNLTSQWKAGSGNILEQGAIRAFESVHGLTMDGTAGPSVWSALLTAAAKSQLNPNGYTYALASQNSPESLKIWHDGRLVFTSASNTGIPAAPTVDGTFPVYLRYYYQIMKGTNPDGSKYADPVYYVAYFNGGDAVHYFPRYSYGYYQSLGCVELPWDSAKKAWPYLSYGSLVTVTGPVA
jgi:peptidoglycan hydrolase-like protein with peptidoglycan-binding domain